MKITNRRRWENTKFTTAMLTWLGCTVYFAIRAANELPSITLTTQDLVLFLMTVSGVNLGKHILKS